MKYKFLAYIPVMATALLSFSACSESFLDRETDGSYITPDQLEESAKWNPNALLGDLNGVTTSLIRWQAGGSTSQSDFGQKSVDISTDIMSHDMVMSRGSNYGYFRQEAQGTATNKNFTSSNWYFYYKVVDACNFTFTTLGSDTQIPEDASKKLYFAQAKTARAFAYSNLVNLFTGDYATYKNKKVLPIYREQSTTYKAPQTTENVYKLIFEDLDSAIVAFNDAAEAGYTSTIDQPSLAVAYTLKAYAYLQMGDNANAKANADLAIGAAQGAGKTILPKSDLNYGFNTVNNNDWLWGVDVTADNTGGLCTFWGMMDLYTYSYTAAGDFKVINSDLFNQIPESDARRGWFTNSPYYVAWQGSPLALLPTGKFHSDRSSSIMGDRSWESDIHFMRIEECYLIAAEAEAREGHTASAATYLKAILDNRDETTAASLASMTNDQLLDEIFFNWRVEMWGEGKSLQTFKRFKKNMTCPANDSKYGVGTDGNARVINYDSKEVIFAIPNQELQYNPAMKDADQ